VKIPPLSEEIKQQTIEAVEKYGSIAEAARQTGINYNTLKSRYGIINKKKESTPEHLEPLIPDGQKLRGTSTLYDEFGNPKLQWVKTNEDLDRTLEIIKEAADALKEDIPKETPTAYEGQSNADLLSTYILTDYHIGQMSWAGETGEDWDTDKSVDFLVKWFAKAITSAPDSEVAILCQLGDFLHYDGMDSVTPTSKHLLDTDSRYARMVNMAIKAIRRIIAMLLKKHKHVHIIMAEGNHDMASSIWLRALFSDKYENEPRITVDNTHLPYYAYEWGKTSIYFHHGHKRKMDGVSKVFASMYREMFGRTTYSYAHMGHYHHVASKEDGMMIVEQHPTMAVKDAYSARGGYVANRGAGVITYSKIHGEVSRIIVRPEMVSK